MMFFNIFDRAAQYIMNDPGILGKLDDSMLKDSIQNFTAAISDRKSVSNVFYVVQRCVFGTLAKCKTHFVYITGVIFKVWS